MAKEYKIEVVVEGALGTLFLGASKLPITKMEEVLNQYGASDWNLEFMVVEQKRFMLFWQREAAIITFSREI
jgi:Na+/glutamate symporter